ncbi:MAG: hypothetical protein F6K23_08925 [Okeania sp. SIO2C9]|uniref:hypothetical protein n=1 Tax=Okeania sp. SIO2C9 TaxID=2607791 RepID=UPI0013C24A68|nr:hypothetical protein [Okeania sp. SIO2C9]NEQ73186.1 hypothetical protein [Okeania sp. SIO2C9]
MWGVWAGLIHCRQRKILRSTSLAIYSSISWSFPLNYHGYTEKIYVTESVVIAKTRTIEMENSLLLYAKRLC